MVAYAGEEPWKRASTPNELIEKLIAAKTIPAMELLTDETTGIEIDEKIRAAASFGILAKGSDEMAALTGMVDDAVHGYFPVAQLKPVVFGLCEGKVASGPLKAALRDYAAAETIAAKRDCVLRLRTLPLGHELRVIVTLDLAAEGSDTVLGLAAMIPDAAAGIVAYDDVETAVKLIPEGAAGEQVKAAMASYAKADEVAEKDAVMREVRAGYQRNQLAVLLALNVLDRGSAIEAGFRAMIEDGVDEVIRSEDVSKALELIHEGGASKEMKAAVATYPQAETQEARDAIVRSIHRSKAEMTLAILIALDILEEDASEARILAAAISDAAEGNTDFDSVDGILEMIHSGPSSDRMEQAAGALAEYEKDKTSGIRAIRRVLANLQLARRVARRILDETEASLIQQTFLDVATESSDFDAIERYAQIRPELSAEQVTRITKARDLPTFRRQVALARVQLLRDHALQVKRLSADANQRVSQILASESPGATLDALADDLAELIASRTSLSEFTAALDRAAGSEPTHPQGHSAEPPTTPAVANDVEPGDIMVVSASGVKLKQGTQVLALLDRGTKFRVMTVKGHWVGGMVQLEGKEETGWIKRDQLQPDSPRKPRKRAR
ncbi:MAG: hypothetical protein HQ582_09625 [Planctomycetes bacterium]|nr:hypothetical protein [Planctomycetota bacterium]